MKKPNFVYIGNYKRSVKWWISPPRFRCVMIPERIEYDPQFGYHMYTGIKLKKVKFPWMAWGVILGHNQPFSIALAGGYSKAKPLTPKTTLWSLAMPHCAENGHVCLGRINLKKMDVQAAFFNTKFMDIEDGRFTYIRYEKYTSMEKASEHYLRYGHWPCAGDIFE